MIPRTEQMMLTALTRVLALPSPHLDMGCASSALARLTELMETEDVAGPASTSCEMTAGQCRFTASLNEAAETVVVSCCHPDWTQCLLYEISPITYGDPQVVRTYAGRLKEL